MTEYSTRYARPEYERRFLLDAVPDEVGPPRSIVDRFVVGTRLRLRTVTDAGGVQRKLGHKVRADPKDPTVVWHTSLYVDPDELAVLAQLEAVVVTKTRHRWSHDGHEAAVDVHDGALAGLVIAELGFADHDALAAYTPSPPLGPEVTHVAELSGPALAELTPQCLATLLEALRIG